MFPNEGGCRITRSRKITPVTSINHKRKGGYALFKKRVTVALGCMAIRTKNELMIRRGYNIRRTKEDATHHTGSMRWKFQRISFRICEFMVQ